MPTKKKAKRTNKSKKSFIQLYRSQMIVAGVLIFAVVASAFLVQSFAAKGGKGGPKGGGKSSYSIKLVPSASTVANGSQITLDIYSDSLSEPVNAVQATVNYPSDKFEYVSSDFNGSAFEVEADVNPAAGQFTVARGSVDPKSGEQYIGKVVLKAVSPGRKIGLTTNGSQLVSSTSNSYLSTTSQKTTVTINQ